MDLKDLRDLVNRFSSEEISLDNNNDILLSITVPVPLSYSVKYFGDDGSVQLMEVRALSPIEVRLSKPPEDANDPVEFVATVKCCWLNYKSCRLVGAILDRLWERGAPLADNIDRLLDSTGPRVFNDVKLAAQLDLTWRKPLQEGPAPPPESAAWFKEAPVRHRRRDHNLGVRTCSDLPRSEMVAREYLKVYSDALNDQFIAGQERIVCICCCEEVLPTRVIVYRLCTNFEDCPHFICRNCFVRSVRSNPNAQVRCQAYGCDGRLMMMEVVSHFRNDQSFYKDVLYSLHRHELNSAIGDSYYVSCHWCHAKIGPKSFLESLELQNCRWCHRCFCSVCTSACDDSIFSKWDCLFAIGVEIKKRAEGSEDELQEILYILGERRARQAAEFYNQQVNAADNFMPCPGCHIPVSKTEGCNKMSCVGCQTNFCYHCGVKISLSNPYQHFVDHPECRGD